MQQEKSEGFSAKYFVRYSLMLALTLALLYFSFKEISWGEFVKGLGEYSWIWVILAVVIGFLEFAIRAARWKMLLRQIDDKASLAASYHGVSIGNLANFAFPRAGELVRCGVVSTLDRKTTFEGALGTVIVERAWDLVCLIGVAILFAIVFWSRFGEFFQNNILDPASGKITVSAIIVLASAAAVFILAAVLVAVFRKRIAKTRLGSKIFGILHNMWQGVKAAFKMKDKWLFLLYTLLLWLGVFATSYCIVMACPKMAELGWIDALFIMIAGSFGWVVPVQGGIGAYHTIIALVVQQFYAMSWNEGVVFATVSHGSQAFIMILLGVVSLMIYTFRKRKIKTGRQA